ncbi:MAG: hypothetical protein KAS32_15650 [Candidatus Peribacteraceae bacterium]|nr:hypothetical protein [Candidatus Peribacteraceae bacterium]
MPNFIITVGLDTFEFPKTQVEVDYDTIIDNGQFTVRADDESSQTGTMQPGELRKTALKLRMSEGEYNTLASTVRRIKARGATIDVFIGRIDPFMDNNFDSTHSVKIFSFSKFKRDRLFDRVGHIVLVKI